MARQRKYEDTEIGQVVFMESSAARRISIRVHPYDGVKVTIPRFSSFDEGLRFFMLKRDWIISTIARQKRKRQESLENGKALSLLHDGAVVRTLLSEIVFVRGTDAGVSADVETERIENVADTGRVYLSLDRPVSRKTVTYSDGLPAEGSPALDAMLRQVLAELLRSEAKLILPQRLRLFAERYGFRYGRVTVKHNSSNWGSCSARGNINLNLNLIRLSEPLCDYVLLHELCHLRHPDHGPAFHDLLERLCSDNMARLASNGDPCVKVLAGKISASRSAQPVHKTLERELKGYRLV